MPKVEDNMIISHPLTSDKEVEAQGHEVVNLECSCK